MVDSGRVEVFPKLDGRNMTMVLAPDKKAQAAKAAKATERKREEDAAAAATAPAEGAPAIEATAAPQVPTEVIEQPEVTEILTSPNRLSSANPRVEAEIEAESQADAALAAADPVETTEA